MFEKNLESCVENLTMTDFKAASEDLKPVIHETNNDETDVAEIDRFVNSMSYVTAELERRIDALKHKKTAEDYRQCLTDCLRAMRNCCGVNNVMQQRFGTDMAILNHVRKLFEAVREHCKGNERIQTLSVGVQFLSNATMGPESIMCQEKMWSIYIHQMKHWLQMDCEKLTNHTCLFINNCLLTQTRVFPEFLDNYHNVEILQTVVRMCGAHDIDFGLLAVEKMLMVEDLFFKLFNTFGVKERMYVLEVMRTRLNDWERKLSGHTAPPKSLPPAHKSNLSFICDQVIKGKTQFEKLKDKEAKGDVTLLELTKMLEVLSKATAFDVFERMSDERDFLSFTVGLLKNIHDWGKSGKNMLSRVDKADKAAELDVDQEHPGYLLRRDLVRIIGNVCYQHKENQDLVRALGGIPLVLEQAVIDDRNPFITQWTEMAVRNLCEGNLENVKTIKDLKIQGIANPAELLNRFGVIVEEDGQSVTIRSARPDASPIKAIPGRRPSSSSL